MGGRWAGVAGTSASCPVVAGIFARLNAKRLAAGGKPMGFLNPFIYQNPSGFFDVTQGINSDGGRCGSSSKPSPNPQYPNPNPNPKPQTPPKHYP